MEAPAARRLFDDFLVVGLVPAKAASPAGSPQLAPKLLYHLIGSDESAVEHTMDFCFPDVENPTNMQISESFTFTLTQGEGTRVFGFCRRLVQDSQLPVCLCVLSQRPWFSLFMHLLDIIQLNYDLGRFVPAFVGAAYEAPLPCGPGKALRIEPLVNGESFFGSFRLMPPIDDRPTGVQFEGLLGALGVPTTLRVLGALMTEQKVVFTGARWGHVSGCAHAATVLLYPLAWQHIYIPVLPKSKISCAQSRHHLTMLARERANLSCVPEPLPRTRGLRMPPGRDSRRYASAPMPFVLGVLSRHLAALQAEPLDNVLFVDVDRGTISGEAEAMDAAQLPSPFREHLGAALARAVKQAKTGRLDNAAVAEAVLDFMVRLLGAYGRFVQRGLGGSGVHADFDEDAFVTTAPPPAQPFLRAMRSSQLFEVFVRDHVDMPPEQRENSSFERAVRRCPPADLGGASLLLDSASGDGKHPSFSGRAAALKAASGDKLRAGVAALKASDAPEKIRARAASAGVAALNSLRRGAKAAQSVKDRTGDRVTAGATSSSRGETLDAAGSAGSATPTSAGTPSTPMTAGLNRAGSTATGVPPPSREEEDLRLALQQSRADADASSRESDARHRQEEEELQLALAISASLEDASVPEGAAQGVVPVDPPLAAVSTDPRASLCDVFDDLWLDTSSSPLRQGDPATPLSLPPPPPYQPQQQQQPAITPQQLTPTLQHQTSREQRLDDIFSLFDVPSSPAAAAPYSSLRASVGANTTSPAGPAEWAPPFPP
jgi:hypothetical protein